MGYVFCSKSMPKTISRLGGILERSLERPLETHSLRVPIPWEEFRSLKLLLLRCDMDNPLRSFFMLLDKR